MGYWETQRTRMQSGGNTIRDSRILTTKRSIMDSFFDNISYYSVDVLLPSSPISATPLNAWITDDSKTRDQKRITIHPNQNIASGAIVSWKNKYWMTLQVDYDFGDIYDRGMLLECYNSLKWQDSDGEIREAWFARKTDEIDETGVVEGRIISLPDEDRKIIVQSNSYTQEFKKYDRFIFSNRAWKIVSLDDLADGIITIVLQEDEINPAVDRVDLRIANYIEPDDNPEDDDPALNITGSDSIYFGRSAEYSVVSDDNLTFSLTADDGVSSTSLASITSQSSNVCTLLAGNKSGYVKLHVQDLGVKRIQIKSLY